MFESLFRHDGWGIGLIRAPLSSLLVSGIPSVTWLPIADRHAFAADPFLVDEGGLLYCFFELLPYATNRGKIAYTIVDGAGDGALTIHDAISPPLSSFVPISATPRRRSAVYTGSSRERSGDGLCSTEFP